MPVPVKIPGYRIVREIGRGGMGTVFLAVQESLGREVALKLLMPQLVADAVACERFLREGRIAARLAGRHIVSVHDVGVHDGQPYLAMEYMAGGAVAIGEPLAPSAALEIVREIALALEHAHRENVIHRDLKPENILRRKDGSFALADFGIACALRVDDDSDPALTREGTTVGTPYYMSPEQLQARPLDGRSDLYSLGVVLYQLLTGRLPYRGTDDLPVGMQHVHAPVPRLPEGLGRYQVLIDTLMAKSPAQRPATGAELAQRIEAIQTNPGMVAVTQAMDTAAPARGKRWVLAAGLVIALGSIGGYVVSKRLPASVAVPPGAATGQNDVSAAPVTVGQSIAVLPLVIAGGDADQQYFSDGLSEALIMALSQFDGLKVIGRNSAFQFRDSKDDSATIGRKLGVAHLLEGSVQRAADMVRISLQLIRAADGSTVWSQRYDRPYKDLFALQDDITQAVAGALHAKLLSPAELAKQADRPPSGNLDAYKAYLQGSKHWHENEFTEAAEFLTRAVQLDPDYAIAWAQLSGARSTVATFSNESPELAREQMREAREAADRALQLAPALGPAHAARAYLQFYGFDHQGALAECRRAVQQAPTDGTVLNGCGHTLAGIGKLGEAIRLRERLLSIEPLHLVNDFNYAELLMAAGRLDEAEKYLRIAEGLSNPYPYGHMMIALLRGDDEAALEIATRMPVASRDQYLLLAAQVGPDRTAADAVLAKAGADDAWPKILDHTRAYQIAQAHALRADADQTMEWLERASTADLLFLLTDPIILRWRDDPRLIEFCRRVGLPSPHESEALSIDQIRARVGGKS